ncbi:hypothetical protein B0H13DRAFT_2565368 [Mycena leptocephala]|nr:hypothetical protein B0H13DRAFT_2565368 [Mycena leptocephala]
MSAATSAFADLQRARNEWTVAELLDPLAASTIYALPPSSIYSGPASASSRFPAITPWSVGTLQRFLPHDNSERNTVGHRREAMSAATSAFDADVQRVRNERTVAELLDPLAASTIYALPPPYSSSSSSQKPRSVVRTRRTFGLVEELFQKQTAIVQAASDGDIDRVARLISMGMDVNAIDRWGCSALSMCGYGGHVAIARLLLDHGANINKILGRFRIKRPDLAPCAPTPSASLAAANPLAH